MPAFVQPARQLTSSPFPCAMAKDTERSKMTGLTDVQVRSVLRKLGCADEARKK